MWSNTCVMNWALRSCVLELWTKTITVTKIQQEYNHNKVLKIFSVKTVSCRSRIFYICPRKRLLDDNVEFIMNRIMCVVLLTTIHAIKNSTVLHYSDNNQNKGDGEGNDESKNKEHWQETWISQSNLIFVLWKTYGIEFIKAAGFEVFNIILTFVRPALQR